MKPYFRVTWNVLKYNLIKFFKCKNLKIRGIVLLGYNTKLQVHKTSQICIGKNVVSDGRCVIIADKNARMLKFSIIIISLIKKKVYYLSILWVM